jgi:hypothetical protein
MTRDDMIDPTGASPRPAGGAGRVPTPRLAALVDPTGASPRPAGGAGRVPTPRLAALVDSLVAELAPVRRLRGPDVRASVWAGLAALCVGFGCYRLGLRPDVLRKLGDVSYLAEAAALLALAGLSARAVFHRSIPGADVGSGSWPALAALAWIAHVMLRGLAGSGDAALSWTTGLPCVARIAGLAAAPAIAMLVMLRRAAPAARRRTGALALVAAAALAVIGAQLVCAKDGASHVLVWHAGPVALIALAGLAAGRALLRRYDRRGPSRRNTSSTNRCSLGARQRSGG